MQSSFTAEGLLLDPNIDCKFLRRTSDILMSPSWFCIDCRVFHAARELAVMDGNGLTRTTYCTAYLVRRESMIAWNLEVRANPWRQA